MIQKKKKLNIAFLLSDLKRMHHRDDTSFAIMHECSLRGHQIHYFETKDLVSFKSRVWADLMLCRTHFFKGIQAVRRAFRPLRALDAVILRKEPPFDADFLAATYLLELEKKSVFFMNDPAGIRNTNEKTGILHFPDIIPPTAVLSQSRLGDGYWQKEAVLQCVAKPLYGMGGKGVRRLKAASKEIHSSLEMLQGFIEHRYTGDKRILVLDGRPLGAFIRVPGHEDFRANMSLGGWAAPAPVTPTDEVILQTVRSYLKKNGLHLVGLDIVGGYLTEINVTCPAGVPEINDYTPGRSESAIVDFIEKNASR